MPKLHVRCTERIESFAHVSTRRGRTRNGRHRPGGRGLEAEGSVSSATTVRRGLGAVMTTLGAGCRETCSSSSTGACWASKPCFEVQIPTFDPMAVAWPTLKKGDREVPRRHSMSVGAVMVQSGCASGSLANPVQGVRALGVRSTCLAWGVFDLATGEPGRLPRLGGWLREGHSDEELNHAAARKG